MIQLIENEVLESEPSAVLKANWRNLGSSNIITNPRKTKYALNIYNKYRDGYENGDGFTWNEIKSKGNVGIYGHVVPYGQYYKIEYYQYFGYSDTLKGGAGNWGDHEGEWEMIEVILEYDDSILREDKFPDPYAVAYSQHHWGETHKWNNSIIQKNDAPPQD